MLKQLFDEKDYQAPSCVGSGYCCKKAPCMLGVQLHGLVAPCPSLVFDDNKRRYMCGEIVSARGERLELLKRELAIGAGCCSPLNSDRKLFR